MPDLDQPVGEYPEMNAAAYLQTTAHAAQLLDMALTSLRAAHHKTEELRRENVALRAQLDCARDRENMWRMTATSGKLTP